MVVKLNILMEIKFSMMILFIIEKMFTEYIIMYKMISTSFLLQEKNVVEWLTTIVNMIQKKRHIMPCMNILIC